MRKHVACGMRRTLQHESCHVFVDGENRKNTQPREAEAGNACGSAAFTRQFGDARFHWLHAGFNDEVALLLGAYHRVAPSFGRAGGSD
jgi:hypothetical protein